MIGGFVGELGLDFIIALATGGKGLGLRAAQLIGGLSSKVLKVMLKLYDTLQEKAAKVLEARMLDLYGEHALDILKAPAASIEKPEPKININSATESSSKRSEATTEKQEQIEEQEQIDNENGEAEQSLSKKDDQALTDTEISAMVEKYKTLRPNTKYSDKELEDFFKSGIRISNKGYLYDPKNSERKIPDIPARIESTLKINHEDFTEEEIKHLKALEKERMVALEEKKKSLTLEDTASQKYWETMMRNKSEAIGEEMAKLVMKRQYPDFEQIPSDLFWNDAKQGQFDIVYYNASTGEIMIVEAKGGGSTRGGRIDKNGDYAEQGTKEYRESILANMDDSIKRYKKNCQKKGVKTDTVQLEALRSTIKKIKMSTKNKNITNIQVSQKINKDGSLKDSASVDYFES